MIEYMQIKTKEVKIMKKILALFFILLLSITAFSCNKNSSTTNTSSTQSSPVANSKHEPATENSTTVTAQTVASTSQNVQNITTATHISTQTSIITQTAAVTQNSAVSQTAEVTTASPPIVPGESASSEYDKNGNVIYKSYIGENGKIAKEEFFGYSTENVLLSHEVSEYTYDASGNLIKSASFDIANSGEKTAIYEQKYIYDNKNRLTEESFYASEKGDGLFLRDKTLFEYDGENTLIKKSYVLYKENGMPAKGTFYLFDGNGKQILLSKEIYKLAPDGKITEIRGTEYDEKNKFLLNYTVFKEYGESGLLSLEERLEYNEENVITAKKSTVFEYSENGECTKKIFYQHNSDDILVETRQTIIEKDENGYTVTETQEQYFQGTTRLYVSVSKYGKDGNIYELRVTEIKNSEERNFLILYTYENNVCISEQKFELDPNGYETLLSSCVNTYDENGVLGHKTEYSYSADGETTAISEWTFYANGKPKTETVLENGVQTLYREYDKAGNLVYEG